jgi:hypothetical protein
MFENKKKVWFRSKICKLRFKLKQQAQISSKHDQKPFDKVKSHSKTKKSASKTRKNVAKCLQIKGLQPVDTHQFCCKKK